MEDEEANEYFAILETRNTFYCGLPNVDVTENAFKSLNEDSPLGANMLPTRILKKKMCPRISTSPSYAYFGNTDVW